MKNYWIKRNPFLSMWLSSANAVAGTVRNRVQAEGRRQATVMMNEGAKQIADFWTAVLKSPPSIPSATPTPRRKRRAKSTDD